MRLITDIFAFCTKEVPQWNTISISGYHIREAGSTAVQEVAFTLANGIAYVEAAIKAGMKVDEFGPRLSFFFNAHSDFLEEVAKYRAARRLWAKIMKERFKAADPRSLMLRFHTQTAGCSLTAQQPLNNIMRVAFQAMSAVLGGTQSLHTNSFDEALALPSETGGPGGPAHPAGHGLRDRGVRHRRPPGGLLLPRKSHGRRRGPGPGIHRPDRPHGRGRGGHRKGLHPERDRRQRLPLPAGDRKRRAHHRGPEPLPGPRRESSRTSSRWTPKWAPSRWPASRN